MATKIGRSLEEINIKTKELDKNVRSLTNQNKLLDKSLKYDTNPLATLQKRASNTQQSITALTDKIELLKQKQEEYNKQLASGQITQGTYDKLSTDITKAELQLEQLNAELKETNKTIALLPAERFKKLGGEIEGVGNKLKGVSVTAAALVASLTAIGLSAVSTADDLATISTNLGITAEELQYLNYVAMQTDVSNERMQKSFVKVRDALGTQLLGETNSATKALDKLGISASNFDNSLDGFYAVSDALGKVKDSTVQATLVNDIFGEKIGTEMISFLNAGSNALKGYENELTAIGVLSNDAVAELADFDNEMNRIKQSFSQAKNELGLAFLPVMEQIANFLETKFIPFINNLVEKFSNLSDGTKTLIVGLLGFLTILAPLLIIIGKVTSGIGGIIGLLPKLSGLLTGLSAHPIIAIIGLIAILLTTLYAKNEKFRESVNKLFSVLSKALEPVLSLIADLFTDIMDLLNPLIDAIAGPLSVAFEFLAYILEPVAELIGIIVDGIKLLTNGIATIFGKGWLWGKDDKAKVTSTTTTEVPDFSNYNNYENSASSNNVDNRVNIESIVVESNEYMNADELLDTISKKLAIKVQARG
jgi:predicted  nucleic acid-binding Zn-ribbon protein